MKQILLTLTILLGLSNNLYADEYEDTLKACERGSGFNCYVHGMIHDYGQATKVDKEKAFYYYKKASDLGDMQAHVALADCYMKGIGTEKNIEEAIKLYKHLCDRGIGSFATGGCKKYQELTK